MFAKIIYSIVGEGTSSKIGRARGGLVAPSKTWIIEADKFEHSKVRIDRDDFDNFLETVAIPHKIAVNTDREPADPNNKKLEAIILESYVIKNESFVLISRDILVDCELYITNEKGRSIDRNVCNAEKAVAVA